MQHYLSLSMKRAAVVAAAAVMLSATLVSASGPSTTAADRHNTQKAGGKAAEVVIEGAEHVHALAYVADGRLLLGTHGGLYASEDDGASWAAVEVTGELASTDFMSIVVHPDDPNVLYASGHGFGVVTSTDGGSSWVRSDSGIDGTDIHALTINQRMPEYLFAFSVGHGVYGSQDGGESWFRIDDGPTNPSVRSFAYMAVQTDMDISMGSDTWGLLFAGTADGIYDSYSCFCGWRDTTDQLDGATVYALATLHADTQTMYAGTRDGLWKSSDEGQTWKLLEGPAGRITAAAINPDDPTEVTAVSEVGLVFRTTNGGQDWDRLD